MRVKPSGCNPEEELCHQSSERGTVSGAGEGRAGSRVRLREGAWPGLAPRAQHPVLSAAAASMGTWRAPAAIPELLPGTAAGRCLQAAGSQRALRCNRDRLVWHRQMQQFRATTDTRFRLGFFSSSPWLSGSRALTFAAHFSAQCSGGGGAAPDPPPGGRGAGSGGALSSQSSWQQARQKQRLL